MTKAKKIYDFNINRVKTQLVNTFKHRKNEATVADLVADTGLPKFQVEQGIKVVLDEYTGHLKATESGELLYYFPQGMKNRLHGFVPGFRQFVNRALDVLGKILTFLFKVWIMVMLVGYFVLFLAIVVVAIVASIAVSASNKDRERSRDSRGGGGFYIVLHLLDLILRFFFYVNLTGRVVKTGPKPRPFYKAVFAFVFGEEDFLKGWDESERQKILAYIRAHKGAVLAEELVTLTGRDPEDVQLLLNRYLLEYEGDPQVTEEGTIVYFFPELLKTQAATLEKEIRQTSYETVSRPIYKPLIPFNNNKKKTNGWIGFFNAFNLLFGSYFFFFSFANINTLETTTFSYLYLFLVRLLSGYIPFQEVRSLILIVLGFVPLAFSFFFFLIPVLRNMKRKKENETIKQSNLRKRIYTYVLSNPAQVEAQAISVQEEDEAPRNSPRFIQKELDRLAALKHGEFTAETDNQYAYHFPELKRELNDLMLYRKKVKLSDYTVGEVIFDSGE